MTTAKPAYRLKAENLAKSFGDVKALSGVSFSVAEGEIFGLIGPDGAGKTTLFRLLTTLLLPDAGSAEVAGHDVVADFKAVRRIAGYMPGRFSLYPDLSVKENLEFFASIFGVKVSDNYAMIAPIYSQLERFASRPAGKLSGGMKQKLALCCALVHKPEILFLDEPTTGVDAVSRAEFWDILEEIKTTGMSVVVSTPYMDEAARCDRIALINRGEIMAVGKPDEIPRRFDGRLFTVGSADNYAALQKLRVAPGVEDVYLFGEKLHLVTADGKPVGLEPGMTLTPIEPTIEDVFIRLMKRDDD